MILRLFEEWLKKEEKVRLQKKRSYPHFDYNYPVSHWRKEIISPKAIARHSFMPFVHFILETPRVRTNESDERKLEIKPRPIHNASHKDAFVFSWYAFQLQHIYEDWLQNQECNSSVLAYRKLGGRTNLHFATEAFELVRQRKSACVALAFDVTGFFDNLMHSRLLQNWKTLRGVNRLSDDDFAVFKASTSFSYVWKDEVIKVLNLSKNNKYWRFCDFKTFRELIRKGGLIKQNASIKGVPQGSPISAVLSNIYMMGFDIKMHAFMKEIGGVYFRYSDDILLICDQNKEDEVKKKVLCEIEAVDLEIKISKTDTTYFDFDNDGALYGHKDGHGKKMQYLGLEFDGKRVFLRSSSVSRYHRKLRSGVRKALKQTNGRNSKGDKVFKRKLYRSYSHHGSKNFISYAYRAARIAGSKKIRHQVKGNLELIDSLIVSLKSKVEYRMRKRRDWDLSRPKITKRKGLST
jgi:RNA-directed DNA polymerase